MALLFHHFCLHAESGLVALALPANGAQPPGTLLEELFRGPFVLLFGLIALFYFIVLIPERRRRADEAAKLSALKKNDRIVTVGGIHGVISAINDADTITIRIDESGSTRMKIDRKAVARVITEKSSEN